MSDGVILKTENISKRYATRPALAAETFGYDKVGNRLSSADYADWTYNNNNALVGYDGVSYTYDQNGNTTRKSVSGQDTVFTYSAKDRLEQVNLPDGRVAVYMYDPFGRRVSKTVDGVTTYFMYADEGLVAEMDVSGNVVKSYGWKPNGTWGTNPVLMTEGGNTYYFHNDHLGTPQKMTDANGAVVWSATYTAFGEAAVDSASTVTNNLRFPGQYYDAETGLHYNFHRYYDPKTGRYVSEDPIGIKGGINLYNTVGNNFINNIDPFGLLTSAEAFAHYIGGSGDPLDMQFDEIDTSSVSVDQFTQVQEALSGGCRNQVIPIDTTMPFSTSGDAGITVGYITLKLTGDLYLHCDCTYTFKGTMSALPDTYNFNASTHRSTEGEALTTIGSLFPGKKYIINIVGYEYKYETGMIK